MPGPYPLSSLSPSIGPDGISSPAYSDILLSLIASMQAIYGSDIYLTPDTQDYQMIAIFALTISDVNAAIVATYNGFAPAFAQYANLSALVGINGLQREPASNSIAQLVLVGTAGTLITNGIVTDANQNQWALPATVIIPNSGTVTVTATCQTAGAVTAAINSINQITTVVLGWQSATNPAVATVGVNAETDAALRTRQAQSTAIASVTPLESILAAIANIAGIDRYAIYENDTGATDGNGVPGHSISLVVEGGSVDTIAQTIESTKSPGTGTYGTTNITVNDPAGLPITINFFELDNIQIYVSLTIQPLTGYVSTTGTALVQAIVDYINGLAIGQDVYYNSIFGPASLYPSALGNTYDITALTIGLTASPVGTSNLSILFNEAPASATANVVLTVS